MKSRTQPLEPATMSEQDGVRYLHLGTPWVQGAMRVSKPQAIELEYVQRMMAWMLWRPQDEVDQGHAVQLGLGAASITRFTHKVMRMRTTAVELNPTVISACRLWFQLPADDARLRVIEADAGAWVQDAAHLQSADVLSVDLYDHDAAAPVLDSDAFYAACRGVLAHGGLMSVNLFGRDASFAASAARIASAFGLDQVWSLYGRAIERCGPTATLLEWDDRIPSFGEVHREALKADRFLASARAAAPALVAMQGGCR